jgi:hypothetical protein
MYWYRKKVKGREYVFVYYSDGRQLKPRKSYKWLDGLDDARIQVEVDQLERQWEKAKKTPDHILFSDDALTKRLDEWHDHLLRNQKKDERTAEKYRSLTLRWAVPFFLSKALKDPASWPGVSVGLLDWLREKTYTRRSRDGRESELPLSAATIREVNNALRSFWRWLREEHLVPDVQLFLRTPPKDDEEDETPLQFTIEPQMVLDFAAKAKVREVKLIALLGYFFSLRPQEIFGLRPADFAAGGEAAKLEACSTMARLGLFGRLAVNVNRQRTPKGREKTPKAHSRGWVACFDAAAAKLIVELINEGDPTAPLFAGKDNRKLYRLWEDAGLERVAVKDLRRASCYHLGHHTRFAEEPVNAQKHMRHKEYETTILYLRRPKEEVAPRTGKLDLGA